MCYMCRLLSTARGLHLSYESFCHIGPGVLIRIPSINIVHYYYYYKQQGLTQFRNDPIPELMRKLARLGASLKDPQRDPEVNIRLIR